MSRRLRRSHSPGFKVKVALAASNGEYALAELAYHDAYPNQITQRKTQLAGAVLSRNSQLPIFPERFTTMATGYCS